MLRWQNIIKSSLPFLPSQRESLTGDRYWKNLSRSYQRSVEESYPLHDDTFDKDFSDPFWEARHKKPQANKSTSRSQIIHRIKEQLRSPEFWLGVFCGAATRLTIKWTLLEAIASENRFATVATILACAIAGIAAGLVTNMARARYRKEKPTAKALMESALIGLFGGILGGYAMNAGEIIASSSSFTAGVTAGAAAGVLHAGLKVARQRRKEMAWSKFALHGALYGAVGGVVGLFFSDLLGSHASVAAPVPVGEAGSVLYVNPSHPPVVDTCGAENCGSPPAPPPQPVSAPVTPVQPAPVTPQETTPAVKTPAHHASHRHHHHHHHHHTHRPARHHTHHRAHARPHHHAPTRAVKHARHLKHIKKLKHALPLEKHIILEKPVPPPLPPQGVVPPQPMPIDPCQTGDCAASCNTISQLDIKGPCADPNTPCVERVVYNDEGLATKVILEPQTIKASSPYVELRTADATQSAAEQGQTQVTLVVPLTRHALALSATAPSPA